GPLAQIDADHAGEGHECGGRGQRSAHEQEAWAGRRCGRGQGEGGVGHHFSSRRSMNGSAKATTGRSSSKLASGGGEGASHSSVWPLQGSAGASSAGRRSSGANEISASRVPRATRATPNAVAPLVAASPPV